MSFDLTILGSNSAVPAYNRHQSAQVLRIRDHGFLIDCGEGTQLQLKKYHIKHSKISHIFISHLHGDHFFGLVGLLSTMNLFGRKTSLTIYAPRGLAEIITTQFKHSATSLLFPLRFVEIKEGASEVVYENDWLTIKSIPLSHRIPCSGFFFQEKAKKRRIRSELIPDIKSLGPTAIQALKDGMDVVNTDGSIKYENKLYTSAPAKSFSYAYCSDTIYSEDIIQYINGVDLLYHESTFIDEHADRAKATFHSTARQAGIIAERARVGKLLLGHFSNRYIDLSQLLIEAKEEFKNTELALEGKVFSLS